MIAAHFDKREVSVSISRSDPTSAGIYALFTREVQIMNPPSVHLSDLETHQEWEQYLKPKRRRRSTAAKT